MKILNGVKYYTAKDIGAIINKSSQTIILWDKYSDELENDSNKRLIPRPIRTKGRAVKNNLKNAEGEYVQSRGTRLWTEEQVEEIKQYSENMKYGENAEFNRRMWGKKR